MRHILLCLAALLPGCFIDAPTYHTHDAGGDDVIDARIDADVDAAPANAVLTTSQSPHNFGDVTIGQMSGSLDVTFTNSGTDPTGTISVTLGGSNPGEFDIVDAGADDCGGKTLAQNEFCIASVRFAPGSAGPLSASLDVAAEPGGTASVSISGVGLTPGDLEITAGVTLGFNTVEIQSVSASQTLTVHNQGRSATSPLTVVLGDENNYLALNDTCSGMPLAADDSCSVDVRFAPTTVGSHPVQVSIRQSPTIGVAASATGTGSARLKVDRTGVGQISSIPDGISCGTGCSTSTVVFIESPVTLTASELAGYRFDEWTDSCAAANPSTMCSVALNAPLTTVGATFVQTYTLNVSTTGSGALTASGISCSGTSGDCTQAYDVGTSVTLTAAPDTGHEVFAWTGAPGCTTGMRACQVTMNQARTVSVEFKEQFTLTVVLDGSGTGTVTGGAISCPGTCSTTLFAGANVTLTQAPGTAGANSQIVFAGWSGGTCSGSETTCDVAFDDDRTVNAAFTLRHQLSVTLSGTGTGTMLGTSAFSCTAGTCTQYFDSGGSVTLTALPTNGTNSMFGGYLGACIGVNRVCSLPMDAPRSTTARFDPQPGNLVFVSSAPLAANLGGATAYDIECNSLATAAGINTSTNDNFVAWMSDNSSLAETRLGASARGFYRMDGLPFADDQATLLVFGEKIFYPIVHDESGDDPGVVEVFTGTDREGDFHPSNCSDWTSTTSGGLGGHGGYTHMGSGWGGAAFHDCSIPRRVYCLAKASSTPVTIPTPPGTRKWIFLTNAAYEPGSMTPDEACDASKPSGSVPARAVVATSTETAASNIDSFRTYYRPDGVLVGTGEQILAGNRLSGPWVRGDGTYSRIWFWSGSATFDSVGTATCGDWTTTSGETSVGNPAKVHSAWWLENAVTSCTTDLPLLCVEQ